MDLFLSLLKGNLLISTCSTDLGGLFGIFECWNSIVWKFYNFPANGILREINLADFTGSKPAILTIFEALKFNFWKVSHLKMSKM